MAINSNFRAFFSRQVLSMRYNSESLKIKVVITGNILFFFRDIKSSLELLITAQKMPALFQENHYLEASTTANNRITEPKIRSKS